MKRVLIAGAASYIGESLTSALPADQFAVETLDMRGSSWRKHDFSGVDAVVQVAGIAHRRDAPGELYYAVNRDLAVETARRAKAAGVGQLIYFSSMSVYGLHVGRIGADTPVAPRSDYGRSKWEAEQALAALADERFHVAVLRPPMIYGPGCKGNYPRLSRLIQKSPVFPRARGERSMLYIGCLCGFIARLLQSGAGGLYFPQNKEYVRIDELAARIAGAHGHRLWQPRGFGWLLERLGRSGNTIGMIFGTLTYDRAMSAAFSDEPQPDFAQTVRETEASE